MIRKILPYILLIALLVVPYFYQLGNDMTSLDDFHFKNWSYVFMKEFESGNYDKLYVSVQPGVLTIYSNIIGFKGLYFAKDKLGIVRQTNKDFELVLNTAQKLPKVILVVCLLLLIFTVLKKIADEKSALLFTVLLSLEPILIGQARVIQTDTLPMLIGFLAVLLLYGYRNQKLAIPFNFVGLGFLTGLCILEKSLYFILFVVIILEILSNLRLKENKRKIVKELTIFVLSTFITLIVLFPAFWGNFLFTLYRLTLGSFIFGVQGLDTETFSYEKTHHIHTVAYYFIYLLNKLSEVIWIGIGIFLIRFKTAKLHVEKKQYVFIVLPLLTLLVLLIAQKKIGRYLIAVFPYLILLATLGYYNLIKTKRAFMVFILVLITLRLIQFSIFFPDYLMYKNPISPDIKYDNTIESWGSGRKKLAEYISLKYGTNLKVYASDYTTLYLYYAGQVLNKEEVKCGSSFDLLITTSEKESVCGKELTPADKFEPYDNLVFYIYHGQN